ncbi:MAG: rhomboid family intramembrane serine protease [Phycisphaeraceae bacterium]
MFFPIRTDRRLKRIPWVNYTLIAVNALIFLFTIGQVGEVGRHLAVGFPMELVAEHVPLAAFYLNPRDIQLHQFISYQFLHGGWEHLLGNMLFLYVFGNSVEDRLGRLAYLLFYLSAGVMAGLGHTLAENAPVLGASGAVAGVTGAFLALFPLSNVTVVYWIIIIGAIEVSGIVVIGIQIVMNVVLQFYGGSGVAYLAHLAGYAHGFAIGMVLLLVGILPREPYDMLALIERRRRRAQFQRMARAGYQPWEHNKPPELSAEQMREEAAPIKAEQEALMRRRSEISRAMGQHDMPTAAQRYRELLADHPDQVLGQQPQLDLANQLMADAHYTDAARAYELFLQTYPTYPQREQVQLILGLLYARYLQRHDRARELLRAAVPRLTGSNRQLAEQLLADAG